MRRPEINESAEETVRNEIGTEAGLDAWEKLTNYLSDLEQYADVLEQQLEMPQMDSAPAQREDARDEQLRNLTNALADAQARLHSIGLLTR